MSAEQLINRKREERERKQVSLSCMCIRTKKKKKREEGIAGSRNINAYTMSSPNVLPQVPQLIPPNRLDEKVSCTF